MDKGRVCGVLLVSSRERACRNCRKIVSGNVCDNCGSTSLTTNFQGLFIALLPEESKIAETLEIKKPGHYAVKVG